jgi:signal transduction histidine kinase
LISNFQQKATKTNYEGVYFLKNATPESSKQYLVVIPVNRFGMVTGYVVLDLSLKRIIPRNVFPELLLDDRFIQYFKNRDFSYAFYVEGKVNSSFGDYNYEKKFIPSWLSDPLLLSDGLSKDGYIHIAVEDEMGNFTIVSSPDYQVFGVITNFSFFFTIGLNLILLGLLMYGAITLYQGSQLNYSARIQLYIYTAFILPLFLVSITTLGLISRSAESQLKDEYVEKSKLLGERITPLIDAYFGTNSQSISELENQLIELAKLANVDASIFLPSGKLLTSSQPLIYEDRILPALMDRAAYQAIVKENEQSFINNEKIGSLTYNSAYFALRSPESGSLLGILSLPFFESAASLEKTQINVVSNIMTIFCVVFILFLVLSFFAVRWLTFPLQFITKTLSRTSLTTSNKPLIWNANDEIGLMVNEYNRMLDNLEQSKIELSRIQKESAWREIAKQVAHEIKNPLTPMKLTLQQLEHAMLTDGIAKDKMKKSLQTLLQQVEILNDIAASFSAFARMPAPILQRIELTGLIKQVINLHADYKEGSIKLEVRDSPIYAMGDEQLLSRVFGNILLNALQSGTGGKIINVQVEVKAVEGQCIISFTDNGSGIDQELREKVFMPHFSTKKSGSGLGLAIAKQGIEQNGGSIQFETTDGEGTTFYIKIPIIE